MRSSWGRSCAAGHSQSPAAARCPTPHPLPASEAQTAAAAALLLVLGAGSFLYFMAPQPAMASMFAWKELPEAPTLDTGASFSVTIESSDSSDGAGFAANKVRNLGFPAFTRVSPGRRQLHQAMVGPYASLDEAERVQRRLTRSGFPSARIFVDESLRNAPRNELENNVAEGNPMCCDRCPDRVSGCSSCPSTSAVRSRRVETARFDVGPMPQRWSAALECPDGVTLSNAFDLACRRPDRDFVRAHMAIPEFARATVPPSRRWSRSDLADECADAVAPHPAAAPAACSRATAFIRVGPCGSHRHRQSGRSIAKRYAKACAFRTAQPCLSQRPNQSPDLLGAIYKRLIDREGFAGTASARAGQWISTIWALCHHGRGSTDARSQEMTLQVREAFVPTTPLRSLSLIAP